MKISRPLILVLFIISVGYTFNLSFAEDIEQTKPEKSKLEKQATKDKAATVKPGKRSEVKTLEEFIPSEEVSSDKPVAFPIDI